MDLEFGPDGNLYYADFDGGTIRRIHYGSTQSPSAHAEHALPQRPVLDVSDQHEYAGRARSEP